MQQQQPLPVTFRPTPRRLSQKHLYLRGHPTSCLLTEPPPSARGSPLSPPSRLTAAARAPAAHLPAPVRAPERAAPPLPNPLPPPPAPAVSPRPHPAAQAQGPVGRQRSGGRALSWRRGAAGSRGAERERGGCCEAVRSRRWGLPADSPTSAAAAAGPARGRLSRFSAEPELGAGAAPAG